jgi:hypothetical protein
VAASRCSFSELSSKPVSSSRPAAPWNSGCDRQWHGRRLRRSTGSADPHPQPRVIPSCAASFP